MLSLNDVLAVFPQFELFAYLASHNSCCFLTCTTNSNEFIFILLPCIKNAVNTVNRDRRHLSYSQEGKQNKQNKSISGTHACGDALSLVFDAVEVLTNSVVSDSTRHNAGIAEPNVGQNFSLPPARQSAHLCKGRYPRWVRGLPSWLPFRFPWCRSVSGGFYLVRKKRGEANSCRKQKQGWKGRQRTNETTVRFLSPLWLGGPQSQDVEANVLNVVLPVMSFKIRAFSSFAGLIHITHHATQTYSNFRNRTVYHLET